MDKEDYKRQIEFNKKDLLTMEFKEDLKKEISNLIFNIQQYCRKGGKEDLW